MIRLIVYFDYTCSYSYAVALWLRQVEQSVPDLQSEWRPFILKEINRSPHESRHFWEQERAARTRTGLAFIAGQAAMRQGPALYERFRFALQTAFHEEHRDIRRPGVLEAIADAAGLDVARFNVDRQNPELLQEAGQSHQEAVERYAVFGTPTLIYPTDCAVYLKLAQAPQGAEAERVFILIRELIEEHGVVKEIKLTRQE